MGSMTRASTWTPEKRAGERTSSAAAAPAAHRSVSPASLPCHFCAWTFLTPPPPPTSSYSADEMGVYDLYMVKRQMFVSAAVISSQLLLVDEIMKAGHGQK